MEVLREITEQQVYGTTTPRAGAEVVFRSGSVVATAQGEIRAFRNSNPDHVIKITKREQETLYHAARGLSNPQIGTELSISLNTVKFYLKNVQSAFGTNTRSGSVIEALRSGILDFDETTQHMTVNETIHGSLSPREREVLDVMTEKALKDEEILGDEILTHFPFGNTTLKKHKRKIFQKLQVSNMLQAVMWNLKRRKIALQNEAPPSPAE